MNKLDSAFVYNDLSGLNDIKKAAKGEQSDAALRSVAQQFESMFLQLILKSSREATKSINADSWFNSHEHETWQQMQDEQTSLSMAQTGGYGLADVIYQQLQRHQGDDQRGLANAQILSLAESGRPELAAHPSYGRQDLAKQVEELAPVSQTISELAQVVKPKSAQFNEPMEFIQQLYPAAQQAAEKMGVPARYLLAQAALETGWGQHVMNQNDGQSSHNLFGIKADARWQGSTATVTTHEYVDGVKVKIQAAFRAYQSFADSFDDYVAFISDQSRYQEAVEQAGDGYRYAQELQKAGYATDPNYAAKIDQVANSSLMRQALAELEV